MLWQASCRMQCKNKRQRSVCFSLLERMITLLRAEVHEYDLDEAKSLGNLFCLLDSELDQKKWFRTAGLSWSHRYNYWRRESAVWVTVEYSKRAIWILLKRLSSRAMIAMIQVLSDRLWFAHESCCHCLFTDPMQIPVIITRLHHDAYWGTIIAQAMWATQSWQTVGQMDWGEVQIDHVTTVTSWIKRSLRSTLVLWSLTSLKKRSDAWR